MNVNAIANPVRRATVITAPAMTVIATVAHADILSRRAVS